MNLWKHTEIESNEKIKYRDTSSRKKFHETEFIKIRW